MPFQLGTIQCEVNELNDDGINIVEDEVMSNTILSIKIVHLDFQKNITEWQ